VSDWLDSFELMGSSLNEGEKSLMRFAMRKERERILKLLENPYFHNIKSPDIHIDCEMCKTIALIKGEQK